MKVPDIELNESESELLAQINFDSHNFDDSSASIIPMAALSKSLLQRGAIPDVRLFYFTEPERNPGGRGKSRQQIFEKNGTSGADILAHPNFWKILKYFIYGPDLSSRIMAEFKNKALLSGKFTGSDVIELTPMARAEVRSSQLNSSEAADEFHKLVLECGASPSNAESIRESVRAVRLMGK
jgi:hypothetical protein